MTQTDHTTHPSLLDITPSGSKWSPTSNGVRGVSPLGLQLSGNSGGFTLAVLAIIGSGAVLVGTDALRTLVSGLADHLPLDEILPGSKLGCS